MQVEQEENLPEDQEESEFIDEYKNVFKNNHYWLIYFIIKMSKLDIPEYEKNQGTISFKKKRLPYSN